MKLTNKMICGDCLTELKKLPDESVDLIITSPPYHNLRVYSNDPHDLSNCESYEEYFYMLGLVIKECERVLKPGCKFCMQFEDYNYTLGRDGHRGKESLTGEINRIFKENNFILWSEIVWERFTAQKAMISDGALWYRNLKGADTITAANFGYVYTYKKQGDCELINGGDVTLKEWAEWASGVWKIPNNTNKRFKHLTPFSEELCRRLIKLYSLPNGVVLDPYAGSFTVNRAAIANGRSAIGIELREDFYKIAKGYFDELDESVFESDDSTEKMIERFNEQLAIGEANKEQGKKEKEEMKQMRDRKKELRNEIKLLEAQLNELGMKKSEIAKLKKSVSIDDFD